MIASTFEQFNPWPSSSVSSLPPDCEEMMVRFFGDAMTSSSNAPDHVPPTSLINVASSRGQQSSTMPAVAD